MGIRTTAKLIYGCNYDRLPEEILEEVNELLDDGELDYTSPYYDAPRDEWVVGVECDVNGSSYIDLPGGYIDIPSILSGGDIELKFYISAHVS